jgi:Domain of unknown function (DUF6602)
MMAKKPDLESLLLGLQERLAVELRTGRELIGHSGAKGAVSESEWCETIGDFLPNRYETTSAIIIDADGETSDQIDLVIYDRHHSPLLFEQEGFRYIPAESVYAVFEVKQELDRGYVEYAIDKARSVRRLRRTSAPFVNAGGHVAARELFRITAGILTTTSPWKPALGSSLESALTCSDPDGQLELGCVITEGSFEATYSAAGEPTLDRSKPDASLMFFLLRLFEHLRLMGTVPAINLREYGQSLEQ